MANSKRYGTLRREVLLLRKHFLPETFNVLGNYTGSDKVQALTRAFLVLSHAEVETYLEGWAKDIARKCEAAWNSSGKVTSPLAFLLVTSTASMRVPERLATDDGKDTPQLFAANVNSRLQDYYKRIRENHGVKEKNVLALFSPLGAPKTAFGTTLLPNLDSFGSLRGEYAHNSSQVVQTVPDPETEYNRVINLVEELKVLDSWLMQCRSRIQ